MQSQKGAQFVMAWPRLSLGGVGCRLWVELAGGMT